AAHTPISTLSLHDALPISSKIKINRKLLHMFSLIAGGFGFILIYFITEAWMLHICFGLVGIAWASILSMPYAMLSSTVEPKKMRSEEHTSELQSRENLVCR